MANDENSKKAPDADPAEMKTVVVALCKRCGTQLPEPGQPCPKCAETAAPSPPPIPPPLPSAEPPPPPTFAAPPQEATPPPPPVPERPSPRNDDLPLPPADTAEMPAASSTPAASSSEEASPGGFMGFLTSKWGCALGCALALFFGFVLVILAAILIPIIVESGSQEAPELGQLDTAPLIAPAGDVNRR